MAKSADSKTPAEKDPVALLTEIVQDVKALREELDASFENTFTMQFVKQKLTEAATGIEQHLRNIKIDAEAELKKAEALATAKRLGQ